MRRLWVGIIAVALGVWISAPALAQSSRITVVVTGEPAAPSVTPPPPPVEVALETAVEPASYEGPVVVQSWDTGAEAATAGRIALALGGGLALIALRPRRALRWMLAG